MADITRITELVEHLGPGPHPSGSPQTVHGGGGVAYAGHGRMGRGWAPTVRRTIVREAMERLYATGGFSMGATQAGKITYPSTGLMASYRSSDGHGVIIPPGATRRQVAREMDKWLRREGPFLTGAGAHRFMGGWRDSDGTIYLDVSRRFANEANLEHAKAWAAGEDQIAIFRLSDFTEIPTGGTGRG